MQGRFGLVPSNFVQPIADASASKLPKTHDKMTTTTTMTEPVILSPTTFDQPVPLQHRGISFIPSQAEVDPFSCSRIPKTFHKVSDVSAEVGSWQCKLFGKYQLEEYYSCTTQRQTIQSFFKCCYMSLQRLLLTILLEETGVKNLFPQTSK